MSDMHQTIIPKSDQLNADDLIEREITIRITGVDIKGGQEQPVSIHFEGDNEKPYKPCKSMCRVMVSAWGPDSKKYIGRSMRLYRDPKVKWGGMEVGGIRISHMTDITDDLTMALTVTRSNKKPFTVHPLAAQINAPAPATPQPSAPSPLAEPDAGAIYITPDQLIDIEDKLKMANITRGKERLLMKAGVKSLSMLSGNGGYERALKWIEMASKK